MAAACTFQARSVCSVQLRRSLGLYRRKLAIRQARRRALLRIELYAWRVGTHAHVGARAHLIVFARARACACVRERARACALLCPTRTPHLPPVCPRVEPKKVDLLLARGGDDGEKGRRIEREVVSLRRHATGNPSVVFLGMQNDRESLAISTPNRSMRKLPLNKVDRLVDLERSPY
eukprot:6176668-Pleurochrysis_carterae.AAC.4